MENQKSHNIIQYELPYYSNSFILSPAVQFGVESILMGTLNYTYSEIINNRKLKAEFWTVIENSVFDVVRVDEKHNSLKISKAKPVEFYFFSNFLTMALIRALPIEEQKKLYVNCRLHDFSASDTYTRTDSMQRTALMSLKHSSIGSLHFKDYRPDQYALNKLLEYIGYITELGPESELWSTMQAAGLGNTSPQFVERIYHAEFLSDEE